MVDSPTIVPSKGPYARDGGAQLCHRQLQEVHGEDKVVDEWEAMGGDVGRQEAMGRRCCSRLLAGRRQAWRCQQPCCCYLVL